MLPLFPPVAPQPRLPSPAASCRRLSTAAFSASAYISAAASDPPRPILRFPRPPAGCPSPLLLPAGLYHPAVSSNLPQPASSLSFSLRPPLPACSPAVSLPPRPHASAVSARCPSTASSFSRSVLPPPINCRFPRSPSHCGSVPACLPPVPQSAPLLPQFPPPDLYCRFPHPPPLSDNFPLSVPAGRLPCLSPVCFSPAASLFFRSHCRRLSTAAFFTPAAFSTLFLSVR